MAEKRCVIRVFRFSSAVNTRTAVIFLNVSFISLNAAFVSTAKENKKTIGNFQSIQCLCVIWAQCALLYNSTHVSKLISSDEKTIEIHQRRESQLNWSGIFASHSYSVKMQLYTAICCLLPRFKLIAHNIQRLLSSALFA